MREQRKKLTAGVLAGLLAFGVAACETDEQALEEFDDPGVEEGNEDF